jgi:hypothetical protein
MNKLCLKHPLGCVAMVAALAMFGAAGAWAAPIINDANFQSDTVGSTGYVYDPTSAWSFSSEAGVSSSGSPFLTGTPPGGGTQAAFLQSLGIGQNSALGTSYLLQFYLASRPGYAADTVNVSLGGASLGGFVNSATSFVQESVAFTATASSELLSFAGSTQLAALESDANIDLVSLSVIPEPASLAVFGIGLFGLGALLRQRRPSLARS